MVDFLSLIREFRRGRRPAQERGAMIMRVVIPAPYPVVGSNRQVRGKLQRETS